MVIDDMGTEVKAVDMLGNADLGMTTNRICVEVMCSKLYAKYVVVNTKGG